MAVSVSGVVRLLIPKPPTRSTPPPARIYKYTFHKATSYLPPNASFYLCRAITKHQASKLRYIHTGRIRIDVSAAPTDGPEPFPSRHSSPVASDCPQRCIGRGRGWKRGREGFFGEGVFPFLLFPSFTAVRAVRRPTCCTYTADYPRIGLTLQRWTVQAPGSMTNCRVELSRTF